MVAASLRCGAAGELAHQSHERRIENRHDQHEHRYGQNRRDAARPPAARRRQHRAAGQKETDKHRAAVAHEDRGRMMVVDEKAEKGGGQGD